MRLPFGRKGLLAASAAAAAVVYWRVRASRREEQDWHQEIDRAVDEGAAAGRSAVDPEQR